MDIKDIQHLAVERIYLVPDASEGQLSYAWCDDPAPSQGMDPAEAVEYVRTDVHDAALAELERERDAYRAAEEHQIALRQKMEEREAALAAHVERLQEAGDKLREPWDLSTVLGAETRRRIEGWDKARAESPVTSLARRDSHPDCELECGAYGTYCKCAAEKSQQAAWDKEEEDLKKVRDGKMSTNTFRRIHFPELAASSKTEDHQ